MRISDWSSDVCSSDLLRRNLDVLARNVASSDLVVLTLGLVETWFDTRTGVVYNGLNVAAVKDLRHQTGFFSATVDQVVSVLSGSPGELKKRNPEIGRASGRDGV